MKPQYIVFDQGKDSIKVSAINVLKAPYQISMEFPDNKLNTFILFPGDTILLSSFDVKEIDTTQILKSFVFKTAYGNPNLKTYDSSYNYQLPFPKKRKYKILQGNDTDFTHNSDFSRYALDFRIPIGDTICAARNGYVVGIVEKHSKHGRDKSYRDFANYITMYHNDGTFSQYVHLNKNGVLVEVDDYVERGQPIAISGHTGWSTEPHLHFAVFKAIPFAFQSIPITLNSKNSKDYTKWEVVGHD